MEFKILGPVRVHRSGVPVAIGGRHHPKALALLLEDANRVVPVDRLIEALWEGTPPGTAAQQVQNVISRLRRHLAPESERLTRVGRGYRLTAAEEEVDLLRCKAAAAEARRLRQCGRDEAALEALRRALSEWDGPPLAGLSGRSIDSIAHRLEELRLSLIEDRIALELDSARCDQLIGELRQLVSAHPLRQRFAEQLMIALYRSGRSPEALQIYADFRARLADQLGIDPGRSLKDLHTAILREAPELTAAATPPPSSGPDLPFVTPALLPADIAAFTGRGDHLAALDALLENELEAGKLAVITGTGGVGKTTLAVRWAHQVADRFPDGQLFVDLRGFDPHNAALGPEGATRFLLEALGVPDQRIPVEPEARFALYRSLLAGRRTLVVLDNAADAAQVRPLLPGGRGDLTLVTSRNPLHGLIASQGAQAHPIRELSTDEAHDLLERRIGRERLSAEPEAATRLIERCARLPLALAIVAARAAAHPDFELAALARELDEAGGGLDAFTGDDPATDIRTVFACSYRALKPDAARLFRLLGLHPGPDLTAPAASSLAAIPPRQTRASLDELTAAHLLTEHEPGRYTFHDLIRAYATELVAETDGETERDTATRRLLDHYLHTACHASLHIKPNRAPIDLEPALPGVEPEPLADFGQAMAWFTDERRPLVAVVGLAADTGFDTATWQLAWALSEFTYRQGHLLDGIAAQATALEAARRQSDVPRQVDSHRMLAIHLASQNDLEGADHHLERALELCDLIQDRPTLAQLHLNMCQVRGRAEKYGEAIRHGRRSLDLFRELGDAGQESRALNAVGWYYAQLERYEEALDHCERALALLADSDNQIERSSAWHSIGFVHQHQGRLTESLKCYRRSLDLIREGGHRLLEAVTLDDLGDVHEALGDTLAAREAWQQAVAALENHGSHPLIRALREKIRNMANS